MGFDPKLTEAKIALNLISSIDMPKVAWDALEVGLDGPAIRRLASLEFPTAFQTKNVLPVAMKEMGLSNLGQIEAAVFLARTRAREILRSESDPMNHLRDFEYLWIQTDYCSELEEYGNLDDEVHVARSMGQPEPEIRTWLMTKIRQLAV
jgi:hypothetical protein